MFWGGLWRLRGGGPALVARGLAAGWSVSAARMGGEDCVRQSFKSLSVASGNDARRNTRVRAPLLNFVARAGAWPGATVFSTSRRRVSIRQLGRSSWFTKSAFVTGTWKASTTTYGINRDLRRVPGNGRFSDHSDRWATHNSSLLQLGSRSRPDS